MIEAGVTPSGVPTRPVYRSTDIAAPDHAPDLGEPGAYPFARGIHAEMYRQRLWTMREYTGFGSAQQTNRRFKFLLSQGQTGLSVAFDLPTQLGMDSDNARAEGEIGRVGVAISTVEDMRLLFAGIPLDRVSTSMTINATAPILLALYELAGAANGVAATALRGTTQNDILKEYAARNTYIYPPEPSLRLATDLIEYCSEHVPQWYPISISGYHLREAGATAVQELAYTFANAIAYVERCVQRGLDLDRFARRLSFFFVCTSDFLAEVAKFRAARRIWARIMRERFGAQDPDSWKLRFHVQTSGHSLTAQTPENNVVRVTLQALAAVFGGAQSLHTNALDEALALPTERTARLALRTQQIIAYETGVTQVVDPLGGAYCIERLTLDLEEAVEQEMREVERTGGAVAAIASGYYKRKILESAVAWQRDVDGGRRVIVGVNRFADSGQPPIRVHKVTAQMVGEQVRRLRRFRERRDAGTAQRALSKLQAGAEGEANLLPLMKASLRARATLGEISGALRQVFGEYRAPSVA